MQARCSARVRGSGFILRDMRGKRGAMQDIRGACQLAFKTSNGMKDLE